MQRSSPSGALGAFAAAGRYPGIELPEPVQIHGLRGDVMLASIASRHNIGGNHVGERIRRALYWRLRVRGYAGQRADCLTDPWREYPAIPGMITSGP